MIDILIPTLWRAGRLPGLVDNIHDTTATPHRIIFAVEADDTATRETVAELEVVDNTVAHVVNDHAANCCGAFNAGYQAVTAPYWFGGGDDLRFHRGWDELCLAKMVDPIRVVGTNDLLNRNVLNGQTATHFLVDTRYSAEFGCTFDEIPGVIACENYGHDYFDTELCDVAKARGVFTPCLDAVVEHMHHLIGKSGRDATYERNIAAAAGDSRLFTRRREEWRARCAA
jgi:hypothetical protein